MATVWGEVEAVDTIGVFSISAKGKLIPQLKELNSSSRLSSKKQITVRAEMNGTNHIIELENLLRWTELRSQFIFSFFLCDLI